MGSSQTNSYYEQKKAIEDGLISFDLNIYMLGENINYLYNILENAKKEENGSLFSYWNFFFVEGDFEKQLKAIKEKFTKIKNLFKVNPKKYKFHEVIIFQFKKKEEKKIDEIFQLFGDEKDWYCPFIIFLFEEEDSPVKGIQKIVPDNEVYYISQLKVFTLKFSKDSYFPLIHFYKILFRICSYYNELGDRIIIWKKDNNEIPIDYNLIED